MLILKFHKFQRTSDFHHFTGRQNGTNTFSFPAPVRIYLSHGRGAGRPCTERQDGEESLSIYEFTA
jgi:hypothetical protein